VSEDPPAKLGRNAYAAEQARLARFFQTISKHRKALHLAIEENFGGRLDPAEWRSAFESAEPYDANRTMVVTGDRGAGGCLHFVCTFSLARPTRRYSIRWIR
jgi:hypothetical protein